jgi:hypothetical protein
MSVEDRETLPSVHDPASMHQFVVDGDISIKIITLVPPHKTYTFDGTKLFKDLPSLITSKLNPDKDVKVLRMHNGRNEMLFERGIFKGTLKEDQNIQKITIAEYFKDKQNLIFVIYVPKQ